VTRHAKASSAGSTQGRSNRSGSFVRGAFAIRGASGGANGSGAPTHWARLVTFSLAAALLVLALFASSALASKQVISDFGSQVESGSYGGELNNPRDVAVNEAGAGPANAGDTYVADAGNNRIERFDSAGNFVSAWGKDTIAPVVNERQRMVVEATGGTYTLSFDGSTTTPIKYNDFYYTVREALSALPSIGEGNVEISGEGNAANPFVITFMGALGGADQPLPAADTSLLTGSVEISTIVNGGLSSDDTGTGFEICTVAAECQAGTASGENGALSSPQSVAVDQDTGNVYVSDRGNRRIDEYDGEGNFIRSFGFDVAESGSGDTGTGYEVCSEADGDTCKAGVAGSGVGQYGEGFAERGFGIAVSPADTNASSGTVYLADSGNRRVDTFDLDGTNPDSVGSSANFGEEQPRSVAVDSRGIVYASDSNEGGDIQRYDSQNVDGNGVGFLAPIVPANNEQQEITFLGFSTGDGFKLTCPNGTQAEELTYVEGETGLKIIRAGLEEACGAKNVSVSGEPPNVTVTFQGALAATDQPQMTCTVLGGGAGSCSVTTISEGHPGPLLTGRPASTTAGLAVNPAGTVLYVLREPLPDSPSGPVVVQQFGPANEPGLTAPPAAVDDTHGAAANFATGFSSVVYGFGSDSTSGRLFIAVIGDPDGGEYEGHPAPLTRAHRVYVLNDASSLPSPTASTPSVTDTSTRSVTFHGEVDPKGGLVTCKFQYSTDETNWTDVNVPGCEALNQNGGSQEIKKNVSGLAPDTHYFVRLQVTRPYFSEFTPVTSAPQGFATSSGPPVITKAHVNAIDEQSVRVTASIDPSHSPTTYVVEYGTSPSLGSSTEPVSVGSGTEPIEVSPVIGGLAAATQYYFKVVATNLVNTAESENLFAITFPATPSFGSCPNERFRTGPSAKLPDCRAYEQVTPSDKYGSDAYGGPSTTQASGSGNGITSYTFSGFPGTEGFQYSNNLLSSFAAGEWSTGGLNTPPSYGDSSNVVAWTPDLRLSFATANNLEEPGTGGKLVMRDSTDGSRTVLIPEGVGFESGFTLAGAFDDDSKVVFEANGSVPVTSGPAPVSTKANVYLYDRNSGELTLAGLLPDSACATPPCVPAQGSKLPAAFERYVQDGHVVSPNGDIYFTDGGTGKLYLRRDSAGPGAATELVSASQKTEGSGPGGVASNSPQPATFRGATPDGSKAFFTSTEELTNDATTGPEPFMTPAIGRANSDGSGLQPDFITTKSKWTAVDSGHVYWTNTTAGTIGRADIGGANPEPNFITGLENPEGIAVDSGHIYWAEARDHEEGHGTIGRATLAGVSVEKEFITGASEPRGVAVDAKYVFWTANAGIGRATITGGNPEQSFISRGESERAFGIAANATNVFWIQAGFSATVLEAKLNGEGGYNLLGVGSEIEVRGLAIDSNYVYWSDATNGRIGRAPRDFSSADPKFITNVHGIYGIAADAGHIYWASDPSASGPPASSGNDLYRYDANAGGLIDLAPDSTAPDGAEVVGVLGYSNDGSRVYFAANGDLDGTGPAQSGNCTESGPNDYLKFSGTCSIYLWQADGTGICAAGGGCVSFVTPVDAEGALPTSDGVNWAAREDENQKASRVSADGRTLVFRSQLELTGYDNTPPNGACEESAGEPLPCPEFFRYDSESGHISCITCNPTGAPPAGPPNLKNPDLYHAPSSFAVAVAQPFLSRNLSADGDRFFFQSSDKLVPADVNGDAKCLDVRDQKEIARLGVGPSCRDVYEWEAPGTPGGSCTTSSGAYSSAVAGCIYLLSTGTGIYPSYLADVSESGDTAFIFSRQKLVPSDEDNIEDIYAVKVDGGLLYQNTPRPANCEGDACRGASSQPSSAPGSGSGVFEGPGNPKQSTNQTRCPKGKRTVHSKGKVRCVAKKHSKKSKAHKHKTHKRAANNDRRASR
jgi:hypothetical protein